MDDPDSLPLTLYKRWKLRPGVAAEDVRQFVQRRIATAYRLLSDDVELGLEVDHDGRSILAVQRWKSGERHRLATTGAAYERWWADYEPSLDEWDWLVEFHSEWQTTVVNATSRRHHEEE